MNLSNGMNDFHHSEEGTLTDYFIFASIIGSIVIISLAIYYFFYLGFPLFELMRIFMGVFFLVFAGFKFLDLKGFRESYVNYDVVASRFPIYAHIYPFLELALALAYFLSIPGVNFVTFILMAIGSYGVGKQLTRGSKIKCACLGSFVKLPLTTVSLVENVVMGVMALVMLII